MRNLTRRQALKRGGKTAALDPVTDPDLLPGLWAEWESIEGMHRPPGESEADQNKRSDRQSKIEAEMARHTPSTLEGATALARLLRDFAEGDDRQETFCANLIAGLERLAGGAA